MGENVKVTVIATGFDGEHEAMMEAQAARASVGPQTIASTQARSMSAHSAPRPMMETAAASRRPVGPPPHHYARGDEARAPASSGPARPVARTLPGQDIFPAMDHDWDVPAFQRNQHKPR